MTAQPDLPELDLLWDFTRPAETEARFRELLPRARESGDPSYLAQLLTQIARTQGLQTRFDEAHATLDEAERLLTPEIPLARVRLLLERGRVFNSAGEPERAAPLFREAWELGASIGAGYYAVDAVHMLAIVEPPERAIEWGLRGIALAGASPCERTRGWLGALYNNLGWTYFDRGELDRALPIFEKAVEAHERSGNARRIRIAHWTVGRCLRSLGRVQEALALQERVVQMWSGAGEEDGSAFEELGECLLALGRAEEARPCFARAHALLSGDAWLSAHEPERLSRLEALARG